MKVLIALLALIPTWALANTTVLEPGDGQNYMLNRCGYQIVNEYATNFDGVTATVTVDVFTNCPGSGRGAKNRRYRECAVVTFDMYGNRTSITTTQIKTWRQGDPALYCDVDPEATFEADGTVLGTLLVGNLYRAYLETP
ncbi:MAG TPA: hypothetical protein VE222_12325 [Nitrospiraceae bacterium]|jgi:hypothetical protein|nr:hypothetical protein [Nitrospiraceae bacterium]